MKVFLIRFPFLTRIPPSLTRFLADEQGQDLVEYALIVAAVAVLRWDWLR